MNHLQTLFLALLLVCGATCANAQWAKGFTQNDAAVSYGYLSSTSVVKSLGDVEMNNVTQLDVETDNRKSIGAINLQYTHRSARKVSYGLAVSYEQILSDCLAGYKQKAKVGELTSRYITFMPLLRFNWVEKKKVAVYSKAAIGMTFISDSYAAVAGAEANVGVQSLKQHFFGFQVSPLGIIVGKKVCGFAEVGFGSQGAAQAGVLYRF